MIGKIDTQLPAVISWRMVDGQIHIEGISYQLPANIEDHIREDIKERENESN